MTAMTDAEITKTAARYMGKPALATAFLALGAVAVYAGLFALSVASMIPLVVAFPLVAYLVYVTYTPLHEAVHNNIAGSNRGLRWLNELTAYVVASILGVSYTMHKASHRAHHRHTNVRGEDPDFVFTGNRLYDLVTGGSKMMANEYKDYFVRVFPSAKLSEKVIVILEIVTFVGWRVALAIFFPVEVLVLCVFGNIAGVTLLGYIFAWIVHTPFNETERFKDTATILMPPMIHKPVTLLWLWQNYHSIHHLFPRVPFFHYSALFDEIRVGMVERGAPIVELGHRGQPVLAE